MRLMRGRFLAAGTAALLASGAGVASADLIFHSPLDSDASSTVGPAGTPAGTPTFGAGKIGAGAVVLNGPDPANNRANEDRIVYGAIPGFSGTGARTISGWVNAASNSQVNWATSFGFVDNGDATPDDAHTGRFFDLSTEGSRYRPHQWGSEQIMTINGLETFDAGNWHHFAITYDPATGAILGYVDGAQNTTHNRGGLNTTNNFQVGERDDENQIGRAHV